MSVCLFKFFLVYLCFACSFVCSGLLFGLPCWFCSEGKKREEYNNFLGEKTHPKQRSIAKIDAKLPPKSPRRTPSFHSNPPLATPTRLIIAQNAVAHMIDLLQGIAAQQSWSLVLQPAVVPGS